MLKWLTNFTYKIEQRASEDDAVYQIACKYYEEVVHKEAVLASITETDHMLCIGGGICPFSAILFHQNTGAKVTVIDNNEECVPKARQVIEKLGISEYVEVSHADGACDSVDLSAYSVVHLALQVEPMEHVFSHIEAQVKPGTKLLVRRPKKGLGAIYDKLEASSAYVSHKACNIGATFLYIKEDAQT